MRKILGVVLGVLAVGVITVPGVVFAFTNQTDTFVPRAAVTEVASLSCATGTGSNLDLSSAFSGIPSGDEERTATNTCTATTNSLDGYELGIDYNAGENGTLAHATSADEFAVHAGTVAVPSAISVTASEAKWGFRIGDTSECTDSGDWGTDGAGALYAGMPADYTEISDDTTQTDQDGETCIFGFLAARGSTKMLDDGYYDCNVTITMKDNTD
ncbi:MAG: hypothetical protein U9Q67_04870 [Patescibacteria group bacterium]|nr:hypothetical protein [Patescibacteria group bacterium]